MPHKSSSGLPSNPAEGQVYESRGERFYQRSGGKWKRVSRARAVAYLQAARPKHSTPPTKERARLHMNQEMSYPLLTRVLRNHKIPADKVDESVDDFMRRFLNTGQFSEAVKRFGRGKGRGKLAEDLMIALDLEGVRWRNRSGAGDRYAGRGTQNPNWRFSFESSTHEFGERSPVVRYLRRVVRAPVDSVQIDYGRLAGELRKMKPASRKAILRGVQPY